MKKLILIQFVVVLLLTSCLVGKKYSRPDMAIPEKYNVTDSTVVIQDTIINLQWFELFGDKVLNSLIQQALDTNINLKNAALRVQQSRSFYQNSKASLRHQSVIKQLLRSMIRMTIILMLWVQHRGR